MCGFFGIVSQEPDGIAEILSDATQTQLHRGPDHQDKVQLQVGSWHLGLSHQRLSILDLSLAGSQPMTSRSGDSVIVYNGEVYNYLELAKANHLAPLQSGSDTEVILEMLESLGLQRSLTQWNGMWAAVWIDKRRGKAFLFRDRVGIKPLYYYWNGRRFFFSSEIKTILRTAGEKFKVNPTAVGNYLLQSIQDSSEQTFFQEIFSLPPGHFMELDLNGAKLNPTITSYWSVLAETPKVNDSSLVQTTRELFEDAVRLTMRSDVPLGVTLSGGVDSSSIAAVMKKYTADGQQLNILSAVSADGQQDESHFIDIMAASLNCPVHKLQLGWPAKQSLELMSQVTWHNDSPIGSFSNIAHYLLMKRAKELGITVVLSGQGADEALCGYKKYLGFYLQSLLREGKVNRAIRTLAEFIANGTIINQFSLQEAKRYLPRFFSGTSPDIRGPRLQSYLPLPIGLAPEQSIAQRQAEDLMKYSVPFLTHYEDRMSMAWSREVRLPFLDYRLLELFVNLPTEQKLGRGWTKYIFRKAMSDLLPPEIAWRKDKQGFLTPQEQWLRTELKESVLNLFSEDALIFSEGFVNRHNLLKAYELYCQQTRERGRLWYRDIFAPVALEVWLQTFRDHLQLS